MTDANYGSDTRKGRLAPTLVKRTPILMRPLRSIIYRYLTNADFYNMYKPRDSESGGGGQTYIDFPTQDVSVDQWEEFLSDVTGLQKTQRTHGPEWSVPIISTGVENSGSAQYVRIYQRRAQSVSIANQTLGRASSNRVSAWHPDHGFPQPEDPTNRQQCPAGLAVYLAKSENEIRAGWFINELNAKLHVNAEIRAALTDLLTPTANDHTSAGCIELDQSSVSLDENDRLEPFLSARHPAPRVASVSKDRQEERLRRVRVTDAQGRQLDPKRRKAVEAYAMRRAMTAYPGAEDTSSTESFDLRTVEGTTEVRIEVKGTLGFGKFVFLTANEVQNARGDGWRTDLFILSEVVLTRREGEFIPSGGRVHVLRDWTPSETDLAPIQYRYRVPR